MKQRLVAAVILKNGKVIAIATNEHECKRAGMPTGEGYDLCTGCDYPNHAERQAIDMARKSGDDARGATLFLFGHTYACEPCLEAAKYAGIDIRIL